MPQVSHIEPGPDTLRILITTDNHVGYNEADPVTGDDAWKTFEEIMNIAKDQDVDMVLQSGDLFHINKPTKKSMYHVMRVLRRTCFGDRPCELEMLSDPSSVFDDGFNSVNYEDPNLNISIPVFAISGNHDDASGAGLLSPLDLLSVSGLVNHFGRVPQNDEITITPILLQKGSTKLSLFGMASVRDERLFKTFKDKKVKFQRPNIREDEWFNLMCVHQNHVTRPNTAYLPEHFLPSFLDLVVWGHEHQCIPHSVANVHAGFDVLQPGSSVATSLSIGEADEKKVFILNVNGKDYNLEPFKLKSIRPFHMLEISLQKVPGLRAGLAYKNQITQYLIEEVENLIKKAHDEYEELNPDSPTMPLPLIRLRVDYSGGFEVENQRRFSNRFVGRVANVNSVIQFHRKNESNGPRSSKLTLSTSNGSDDVENVNIENFITNYLKDTELNVLPETGFNNAIKNFIDKDDKTAIKEFIDNELTNELRIFMANDNIDLEEDGNLKDIMKKIKKERDSLRASEEPNDGPRPIKAVTKTAPKGRAAKSTTTATSKRTAKKKQEEFVVDSDEEMLSEPDSPVVKPKRAARATASKKIQETIVLSSSEVEDDDEPEAIISDQEDGDDVVISSDPESQEANLEVAKTPSPPPKSARGRGRGRGTGRARGTASTRKTTSTATKKAPATSTRAKKTQETPVTDTIAQLLARKKK